MMLMVDLSISSAVILCAFQLFAQNDRTTDIDYCGQDLAGLRERGIRIRDAFFSRYLEVVRWIDTAGEQQCEQQRVELERFPAASEIKPKCKEIERDKGRWAVELRCPSLGLEYVEANWGKRERQSSTPVGVGASVSSEKGFGGGDSPDAIVLPPAVDHRADSLSLPSRITLLLSRVTKREADNNGLQMILTHSSSTRRYAPFALVENRRNPHDATYTLERKGDWWANPRWRREDVAATVSGMFFAGIKKKGDELTWTSAGTAVLDRDSAGLCIWKSGKKISRAQDRVQDYAVTIVGTTCSRTEENQCFSAGTVSDCTNGQPADGSPACVARSRDGRDEIKFHLLLQKGQTYESFISTRARGPAGEVKEILSMKIACSPSSKVDSPLSDR